MRLVAAEVISRQAFLSGLGYQHADALVRAVDLLASAGLVNPKRDGMAASKQEPCRDALARAFILLCDRCAASEGEDDRQRLPVANRTHCERCAGSSNRGAIERAATAFRGAGLSRLVVVGGSPGVHEELLRLWPLKLRIVDGSQRHRGREAVANLAWADLVVVWASTELNHSVSEHYTGHRGPDRRKVTIVARRGIEALADRVRTHSSMP